MSTLDGPLISIMSMTKYPCRYMLEILAFDQILHMTITEEIVGEIPFNSLPQEIAMRNRMGDYNHRLTGVFDLIQFATN